MVRQETEIVMGWEAFRLWGSEGVSVLFISVPGEKFPRSRHRSDRRPEPRKEGKGRSVAEGEANPCLDEQRRQKGA